MKNLYIFSACVLAAVALGLAVLHVRYLPPPVQLPALPQPEAAKTGGQAAPKPKPDPEVVWKNNLFDPERGRVEKPDDKAAAPPPLPRNFKIEQLELQGIFKFGDTAKAIINDKNPPTQRPPLAAAMPAGKQPPARPGARPKPAEPPKPKKVFGVGEEMPSGLTVKAITPKSVILTYQTEEYTLELLHGDRDSAKRNVEAPRQEVNIIGSGSGAQPGTPAAADGAKLPQANTAPPPPRPFSAGANQAGGPGAAAPSAAPGTQRPGQPSGMRPRGRLSMRPAE